MKKLFIIIQNFFFNLFNFRKLLKFSIIKKKLQTAIINQRVDAIILKHYINQDIRKCLRIDGRSKFIPLTNKNRAEIKLMIETRHGEQMKYLNVKIGNDLKFI